MGDSTRSPDNPAPDGIRIRPVTADDRPEWQSLWDDYLVYYQTDLPAERTEVLWKRILDPGNSIECLVAESGAGVVGLVQFFPHPDTWEIKHICYLQDLIVDESHRRAGIGEAIIRAVQQRCVDEGWAHVYWQTEETNTRAQGLYNKMAGGPTGFIVYQLDATEPVTVVDRN